VLPFWGSDQQAAAGGWPWHFDRVLWHPRPFFMPLLPRAAVGATAGKIAAL